MRIDPTLRSAILGQSDALQDKPSQSFEDFLGDAAAQRGRSPSQASSFGAKGLFGTAVSAAEVTDKGQSFNDAASLNPSAVSASRALSTFGRLMASVSTDDGSEARAPEPADPSSTAANTEAPETGDAVATLEAPPNEIPDLALGEIADPLPSTMAAAAPEPTSSGFNVLLSGDEATLDVAVVGQLDEPDRARFQRQAARALAEHGWRLGRLGLNGEVLNPVTNGDHDGRRPG